MNDIIKKMIKERIRYIQKEESVESDDGVIKEANNKKSVTFDPIGEILDIFSTIDDKGSIEINLNNNEDYYNEDTDILKSTPLKKLKKLKRIQKEKESDEYGNSGDTYGDIIQDIFDDVKKNVSNEAHGELMNLSKKFKNEVEKKIEKILSDLSRNLEDYVEIKNQDKLDSILKNY